jgi:hypothetical protein
MNRYWIMLTDDNMILQTVQLLQLLLELLPKWLGIDYKNMHRAELKEKPNQLVFFLP